MFGFAKPFRYTTSGGPSPCPRDDHGAFGYYAASALPSAHWHVRVRPQAVKRHGSSPVPTQELKATRSDLLYAGRIGDTAYQREDLIGPPPSLLGLECLSHRSLRACHDASNRGFSRSHRSQDACGRLPVAGPPPPFLCRLLTAMGATHRRPLHRPHTVVHVRFAERTISCAVKGRTLTNKAERHAAVCASAPVVG